MRRATSERGATQARAGVRAACTRALTAVFLAATAFGCAPEKPAPAPAKGPEVDVERAAALLEPTTPLPARAEVVALTDALAVAATQAGRGPDAARLTRLAADLRARLHRLDHADADAREALEQYASAARLGLGSEDGCEADRRRALLSGELAGDPATAYRELYLAARRHSAAMPAGDAGEAPRSRCLAALDDALVRAGAYRPSIVAMRSLERDGAAAAETGTRAASLTSAAPPATAPSTAASADLEAPPASAALADAAKDVVVSPKADAVGSGPVKVLSIERFSAEKGARVVINLSAPTTFQVGTLGADQAKGKDARVFVDLARATSKGVAREIEIGGAVRRVRVGAREEGTRVVLDLASALYRRVFYLPDPFRVVIDVSTRPPVRDESPDKAGHRTLGRVAIDAGHGGVDDGAVGPTGLREKDITLDIAHRVAPLLSHELHMETLLTRDTDTYVPLELRTARANAFHADLFLSVHCNASENGQARGVQTFVFDRNRDPEGFEARVAARENAPKGRAAGLDARALDDQMATLFTGLGGSELAAKSRHVADLLHRSALASLLPRYPDTKDQGIKTAGFYVLVGADMPAVLFETSFISNPDDEARLGTADYRQKLADSIANAIRAYRDGK